MEKVIYEYGTNPIFKKVGKFKAEYNHWVGEEDPLITWFRKHADKKLKTCIKRQNIQFIVVDRYASFSSQLKKIVTIHFFPNESKICGFDYEISGLWNVKFCSYN